MGFVSPIDRHPCPLLSAITSQMFPPQNCPQVCGHQYYSLILETDNNCLAVISLDIITVSINSLSIEELLE